MVFVITVFIIVLIGTQKSKKFKRLRRRVKPQKNRVCTEPKSESSNLQNRPDLEIHLQQVTFNY